jgi:hypothetical protein
MAIFTDREIDLLNHRLSLYDCLQEVLADDVADNLARLADIDTVWQHCTNLQARIERRIPVEQIVAEATPLDRWILTDVIEGSTWLASIGDDLSPQVRNGAVRVAESTVRKLRAAGLEVGDVPLF